MDFRKISGREAQKNIANKKKRTCLVRVTFNRLIQANSHANLHKSCKLIEHLSNVDHVEVSVGKRSAICMCDISVRYQLVFARVVHTGEDFILLRGLARNDQNFEKEKQKIY